MIKVEIVGGPKKPNRIHQIAGVIAMLLALLIFAVFTVNFLIIFAPIIAALVLFSAGLYLYNKT
ncbi:MAG: hypothetical protein J7K00_02555 [Candidatus Diapherotrites archaeon]|nr:hypothetical protein [Candidatus Diapherotrites archaeon]